MSSKKPSFIANLFSKIRANKAKTNEKITVTVNVTENSKPINLGVTDAPSSNVSAKPIFTSSSSIPQQGAGNHNQANNLLQLIQQNSQNTNNHNVNNASVVNSSNVQQKTKKYYIAKCSCKQMQKQQLNNPNVPVNRYIIFKIIY